MADAGTGQRPSERPPDSGARAEEANRQRDRGGGGARKSARPPDAGEERRPPRRSQYDRGAAYGYGDGVERAHCRQMLRFAPPTDGVSHRTGIATLALHTVSERPAAMLLCDHEHAGPHVWPDGEVVASRTSATPETES
ncbi:MAG: hypothetical protein ACR2OO_04530 [Thermomicrobiales bacterium]